MTLSFSKRHTVLTKWKTFGEHNGKVSCSFRMAPIIVVKNSPVNSLALGKLFCCITLNLWVANLGSVLVYRYTGADTKNKTIYYNRKLMKQ